MSGGDAFDRLALAPPAVRQGVIAQMDETELRALDEEWQAWAHGARRMPPEGDWRVWLMLAGRGFGKTRTGAEW